MKLETEAALLLFVLVVMGAVWSAMGYVDARHRRGPDAGMEAGR